MKMFNLVLTAICVGPAVGEDLPLNPHLEPLRPLLEKTWKGTFTNSKPGNPIVDVARWERILNGQAVRRIHSVNEGAYGGESLIFWDEQKKTVSVYYVTTAGFQSLGTLEFKAGKFMGHENVQGDAGGVTEVRWIGELLPSGKFHLKAEYLKNGQWTFGREVTYEESPGASVVFK
jgi:hypothetical protein